MSVTSAAGKFANLHDYPGQSKKKNKSPNNVEADSSSSGPNNFVNLIDHTEYYSTKQDYPSTSGEIYDRRRMLKSIHPAKHSAPATFNKYRPTVKPLLFPLLPIQLSDKRPLHVSLQLDKGRSPQQEQIDNLREELYGIKRNYANALKENVVLKTRLKRSSNEILKRDRQLQNLLFLQSKCYAPDDHRGEKLAMKQKIVMLESLLKEKTDEISRLKHGREAMKITDYQKHIAALQSECEYMKRYLTYVTHSPSIMPVDLRPLPKKQKKVPESDYAEKLKEALSFLEKENDEMRSKLQVIFNCSNYSPDVLSTFERDELIALIIHLKNELKKKERWKKKCNTKSGRSRLNDTSAVYDKIEQLRIKNDGTEEQLKTEIIKIHSDDEAQITPPMNIMKMTDSPKIVTLVKQSELGGDNLESPDCYKRTTKTEAVPEAQTYSISETESVAGQAEDEDKVDEQKEHVPEPIQKKMEKYKEGEDQSDVRPVVENNKDKSKKESSDISNGEKIKENSNDCNEVQKCAEKEDFSNKTKEQFKKLAHIKEIAEQESRMRFENEEETELEQNEIMHDFFLRSILRTTSAHLKRLALLIAKTNSISSSVNF